MSQIQPIIISTYVTYSPSDKGTVIDTVAVVIETISVASDKGWGRGRSVWDVY